MSTDCDAAQVSLITPMYLCESYVEDFLDSMCAQKHQNIEIICVIDGSPDGTLDKVTRYAQKDSRIKVISIEHSGAGAARNIGLKAAGGKYLMFPDADDSFKDTYVSSLLNSIEAHRADLAVSQYELDDNYLDKHHAYGFDPIDYEGDRVYCSHDISDPFVTISNVVHNKIFKKSYVLEHGLRFMETRSLNDVFFSTTALLSASRIVFLNEAHYTYRKNHNPDSISRECKNSRTDGITVFKELYEWLASKELFQKYTESLLARWRQIFIKYAVFGYDKKFCETVAHYLATEMPWKSMSAKKLIVNAGLDASVARVKQNLIKNSKRQNAAMQKDRYASVIQTKAEIRMLLRDEHGIDISPKDHFICTFCRIIRSKTAKLIHSCKASIKHHRAHSDSEVAE